MREKKKKYDQNCTVLLELISNGTDFNKIRMKYPSSRETTSTTSRYYETYSWNKMENAFANDSQEDKNETLNKGTLNKSLTSLSKELNLICFQKPDVEGKKSIPSREIIEERKIMEIINFDEEKNSKDEKTKYLVKEVSGCFEERLVHAASTAENDCMLHETSCTPRMQTPLIAIAAKSLQSHVSKQLVVLKKYLSQKIVDYVAPNCTCCSACQSLSAVGSSGPYQYLCQSTAGSITSCQNVSKQSRVSCSNLVCSCNCCTCPFYQSLCNHCLQNTNHSPHLENRCMPSCQRNLMTSPHHRINPYHRKKYVKCAKVESDSTLMQADSCDSIPDEYSFQNRHGRCANDLRSQSNKRHKQKSKYKVKKQDQVFGSNKHRKSHRYHCMRQPEYDQGSNKIFIGHVRVDNRKTHEKKFRDSKNDDYWNERRCLKDRNGHSNHRDYRKPTLEEERTYQRGKSPLRAYFRSHQGSGFHCSTSRKQRNERIFSSKPRHPSVSSLDHHSETDDSRINITERRCQEKKMSLYDSGFNESPTYSQKGGDSRNRVTPRDGEIRLKFVKHQTKNPDIFKFSKAEGECDHSKHMFPLSDERILCKSAEMSNIPNSIESYKRASLKQPSLYDDGISLRDSDRSRSKSLRHPSSTYYRESSLYSGRHRPCMYHVEDCSQIRNNSKKMIKMKICRRK